MDARDSTFRRWTRRVLAGAGLTVYTLALGEVFVRVLDPQPLIPRYVTATPWGVRGNLPNATYWHTTEEVSVQYRINSQGMRSDNEFTPAKLVGACRVALFGDSFFMGYELDLADTYATRLEQRLRDDGFAVEVLNFSVSGFGTAEMLRTYEQFGRQFDPDVVIFEWHATDPDDNMRASLYQLVDGQVMPSGQKYLPATGLQETLTSFAPYRFIADNSHLYSALREKAASSVKRMLVDLRERLSSRFEDAPPVDEAGEVDEEAGLEGAPREPAKVKTQLSGALLTYADEMMRHEGRSFLVVDVPRRVTRTSFVSTIEWLPAADRERLPIVSPIDEFARSAAPDVKLYYEKGHGHFTPAGIALLVDVTAPYVELAPQLAPCRSEGVRRASLGSGDDASRE
jgi:hypothetical protein